jgi:hypothetical protein
MCPHTRVCTCTHIPGNPLHSINIAIPRQNLIFVADALSKSTCAVKILMTMPVTDIILCTSLQLRFSHYGCSDQWQTCTYTYSCGTLLERLILCSPLFNHHILIVMYNSNIFINYVQNYVNYCKQIISFISCNTDG